jgi:hypothetical protein
MRKPRFLLQQEILAVLEEWPSYETAHAANPGKHDDWARPRDIIQALGMRKTATTRATVSRALSSYANEGSWRVPLAN